MAAQRDDAWFDVIVRGFNDNVWRVQEVLQSGFGKEWHTDNLYQAEDVGGHTKWVQAELGKSGKKLTNLGAGNGNDCWYISVEHALREFGQTQGSPEEFRRKLASYGRDFVLPSYPEADPNRNAVNDALRRIEGGHMAESAEVKWTANLSGCLILLYSQRYAVNAKAPGVSHALWNVIVPRDLEGSIDVTSPACLDEMGGKILYLHSDGSYHYQAYLDDGPTSVVCKHAKQKSSEVPTTSSNIVPQLVAVPSKAEMHNSPDRFALVANGLRMDLPYYDSRKGILAEQTDGYWGVTDLGPWLH